MGLGLSWAPTRSSRSHCAREERRRFPDCLSPTGIVWGTWANGSPGDQGMATLSQPACPGGV